MTYECHRCVADEKGAGGQTNEGGSSSSAGGESKGGKASGGSASGSTTGGKPAGTAGTSPNPPEDNDTDSEEGGCSVSQAPSSAGALGSGLFVLGLAFAGIARRRSQAR
jgi:MYXO-CTERM domain-containing protein